MYLVIYVSPILWQPFGFGSVWCFIQVAQTGVTLSFSREETVLVGFLPSGWSTAAKVRYKKQSVGRVD